MARGLVYLGLSGGVDSSVAGYLLKKSGYQVRAVYLKNWAESSFGNQCPYLEDLESARLVSAELGIDLEVWDYQEQYKKRVLDYMLDTYQAGKTPNPDIACNQEIKFKMFFEDAIKAGADYIATGHYARLGSLDNQLLIRQGLDLSKDQSYFLSRIDSKILDRVLLPIGDYHKSKVREIARNAKLSTSNRKDSQGLCFVGEISLVDFMGQYLDCHPGEIVDELGNLIGRHKGYQFYTIGQRHGLAQEIGKKVFVYKIDAQANRVHVTYDQESPLLYTDQFDMEDLIVYDQFALESMSKLSVVTRYHDDQTKVLELDQENNHIRTIQAIRAVTPGQYAVLYSGDYLVASGVIV